MVGNAVEEGADALRRQVGARRVVGVADQDELGRHRDLGQDRVEIVDIALGERDADLARTRQRGQVRIDREGRPRVDELGARLAQRLRGGEQDLARAVADGDPGRVGVVALGDPATQQPRVLVRIAVGLGGRAGHGLDDGRVRRPRRLVGRELDRVVGAVRLLGVGGVHAGVVVRHAGELVGECHAHGRLIVANRYWADCRSERSSPAAPR